MSKKRETLTILKEYWSDLRLALANIAGLRIDDLLPDEALGTLRDDAISATEGTFDLLRAKNLAKAMSDDSFDELFAVMASTWVEDKDDETGNNTDAD